MARQANVSTITPLAFSTGNAIKDADLLTLIRQMNWSGANRMQTHAGLNCGDANDLVIVGPLRITVTSTVGVFRTRLRFTARISRDAVAVTCRYQIFVDAVGTTIRSRLTVGAAAAVTTSHTSAGNGTDTAISVATSSSGTGFREITLELERNAGVANASLDFFTCYEQIISSLTAPVDE